MKTYDTIVIGAGPVGSRVACKLASLGYQVLVLDKKASPDEDVCCTGILSKECLNTFSLNSSLVLRESSSAKFFSPSGRCLRLWRETPVASVVDRPALNVSLAEQARKAGAEYLLQTLVTNIRAECDCIQVKTLSNLPQLMRVGRSNLSDEVAVGNQGKETILKARSAIIATGFDPTLPQKLGLGKIENFLFGTQAKIETNINEIEVYFDHNLTPGGFAWLVPTREGKGLVGLLTRHKADFVLKSLLTALHSQSKITSTEVTSGYGIIPVTPLPRTYTNHILVVGEAAGQIKPTTGGGVYYGLLCADIAGDVLHRAFQAGDFSANRLSAYEKQWRARLGKELTIGYWVRWLYCRLGNRSIEYFFRKIADTGVAERIAKAKNFSFDWHSQLVFQTMYCLLPFNRGTNRL